MRVTVSSPRPSVLSFDLFIFIPWLRSPPVPDIYVRVIVTQQHKVSPPIAIIIIDTNTHAKKGENMAETSSAAVNKWSIRTSSSKSSSAAQTSAGSAHQHRKHSKGFISLVQFCNRIKKVSPLESCNFIPLFYSLSFFSNLTCLWSTQHMDLCVHKRSNGLVCVHSWAIKSAYVCCYS